MLITKKGHDVQPKDRGVGQHGSRDKYELMSAPGRPRKPAQVLLTMNGMMPLGVRTDTGEQGKQQGQHDDPDDVRGYCQIGAWMRETNDPG